MFGRRRLVDEIREINREILRRLDQIADRLDEDARLDRDESRKYFEALHAKGPREHKRIDDMIAENRAQRRALKRRLDRLDDGGTAPAG